MKGNEQLIRNTAYFAAEINGLESERNELNKIINGRSFKIQQSELDLEKWLKKDLPEIERKFTQLLAEKTENHKLALADLEAEKEKIRQKIEVSPDSFYGYLSENSPDWMEQIGKICDESVLFRTDLNPKQAKEVSESLYGVELDLEKLEVIAKSLETYQEELKTKSDEIRQTHQAFLAYREAQNEAKNKEEVSLRRKVNEVQKVVESEKYEQKQAKRKVENLLEKTQELHIRAKEKQDGELRENYDLQTENKQQQESKQEDLESINATQNGEIGEIRTETVQEKLLLQERNQVDLNQLQQQKNNEEQKWRNENEQIAQEKERELKGEGVDTTLLNKTEKEIASLQGELSEIAQFKSKQWKGGGDYQHLITYHKPHYIDKLPHFLEEKKELDLLIETINKAIEEAKNEYEKETAEIQKKLAEISKQTTQFEKDLTDFDALKQESYWHIQRERIEQASAEKLQENERETIQDLNLRMIRLGSQFREKFDVFRKKIVHLIERFRPNNSLGFQMNSEAGDLGYEAMAQRIGSFSMEEGIRKTEQETAGQQKQLISVVHKQFELLKSQLAKVGKAVASVSRDISNSGFTNANLIVSFDMKMVESNNPIILEMEKIGQLKLENAQDFGELALGEISEKPNTTATNKLRHLKEAIENGKKSQLRLQDMFELAFSYDDKRNKKTNETNLNDIGSEGTTILIKSCIYISLLHFFVKKEKHFKQEAMLHCIIDEVGKISEPYLKMLLEFAKERQICLLNALPNKSKLETYYDHTYKLREVNHNGKFIAKVDRLLSKTIPLQQYETENS